jgi:hypothetical protein
MPKRLRAMAVAVVVAAAVVAVVAVVVAGAGGCADPDANRWMRDARRRLQEPCPCKTEECEVSAALFADDASKALAPLEARHARGLDAGVIASAVERMRKCRVDDAAAGALLRYGSEFREVSKDKNGAAIFTEACSAPPTQFTLTKSAGGAIVYSERVGQAGETKANVEALFSTSKPSHFIVKTAQTKTEIDVVDGVNGAPAILKVVGSPADGDYASTSAAGIRTVYSKEQLPTE